MAEGIQTLGALSGEQSAPSSGLSAGTMIAERYRVEHRIAEGGMAAVFLASDLRHDRKVAVKVLHDTLAHTIGVQRFLREIEVVARLQHPHLLTLIDSGTINGFPYYIMPYVEAQSLRETIAEHGRLSLDEAIRIAREVADGLAYAHERGVVHRDIKPSNILMSDGHAMVADFGIATAIRKSAVGRITLTGTSLGSPTYMSPEQAAGESDVDPRTDVYSLACVVFEMLTGQPPIDEISLQQMVTAKLTGGYHRLRELRPDLPLALEAAIDTALSPDREKRFATIDEFSRAITATLPSRPAVSPRVRWAVAVAAVAVVVVGLVYMQHQRRIVWATRQVSEISRLVRDVKFHAAFQLAQQVLPILPTDSALLAMRPAFTDFLDVVTVPPGATVSIRRLGESDTTWRRVGVTPLKALPMPKLMHEMGYQMRIVRPGYETVDVLTSVFTNLRSIGGESAIDTMYLDTLGKPTAGMARIHGFRSSNDNYSDFHIAKREVTNREFKRFVDAGGYRNREYWTEPMTRGGKPITWEDGVATLVDRSGQPGPSTWSGGTFPAGEEDFPVGGVSWYEAAAYARFAKMRLPTAVHWARAATRNNRELLWMYARSANMNGTGVRRAGEGTMNAWGLYDVAGNLREWCVNPLDSGRTTRGGTWQDSPFHINHLISKDAFDRSPLNGFRLAHYEDPDSVVQRLSQRIARPLVRDFTNAVAASNATFEGYKRMYDYDARPLEPKLEAEGETSTLRWQKVSFTAAYAGPRMAAYLVFPRDASGPFEPIVMWGASNALTDRRFNPQDPFFDAFAGFIPRSGRMLVVPLYMGTYERDDSTFSINRSTPDTTASYRDLTVQWVKDFRRTIDFLETRKDIRADHVGFYGASWGGFVAPIPLSIEPRVKAAVLYSAGFYSVRARDEIETVNYAPHVHTPTLMLNGRYDTVFPYETSQKPLYDQLGTTEKRMIVADGGHVVSPAEGEQASLTWFNTYLGRNTPSNSASTAGKR